MHHRLVRRVGLEAGKVAGSGLLITSSVPASNWVSIAWSSRGRRRRARRGTAGPSASSSVARQRDVVALHPLDELERSGADRFRLGIRTFDRVLVESWLKYSKKSKIAGRGRSDLSTTVYLSGVSMVVNQLLWLRERRDLRLLGSRTRSMLYLTSSLVNSRPVCQLDALAQVELDLRRVAAELPAFGQHAAAAVSLRSYSIRRSNTCQLVSY